ncbi:hypothetical protein BH10PSE4_BH10PSE4_37390 [soil metagenome]
MPADTRQDVGVVPDLAIGDVQAVVALRAVDVAIVGAGLQAVEVLLGDEVDDAGDGVRTVGRRRAVLQHLDPADGRAGDDVGVDNAGPGRGQGVDRHAPAVQQHQGALRAQAAQVDRARAFRALGATVELVGVAQHAVRDRQRLEQFHRRGRALLLQVLGADHIDRQRGVLRRAANERTGDDDLFDLDGAVLGFGLGLGGAARQGRDERQGRGPPQERRSLHYLPSRAAFFERRHFGLRAISVGGALHAAPIGRAGDRTGRLPIRKTRFEI